MSIEIIPDSIFFFEFFVKMDLGCFQRHIFNTCVSFNILVLYMLKNNNYTCLKKTIHFLMKLLIEKKCLTYNGFIFVRWD